MSPLLANGDVRACPACGERDGGDVVTAIVLRTPDEHPLGEGYHVVTCVRCGTGFANVIVSPDYYDRYYSNLAKYAGEMGVYAASPGREVVADPTWLAAKADDSASRVAAVVPDRSARVLDLGCSTGAILGALGRIGFTDLTGVDPSPDSIRVAASRPFVRAEVGTLSALPRELGTFDLVCFTGVLEHLWDVDSAMSTLRSLLRPGGAIYVEVPDAARYLDPYVSPFEDFSTEHVNHFSFSALRRLARRFGLVTVAETPYLAALTAATSTACAAVAWREAPVDDQELPRDDVLVSALRRFAERSTTDYLAIEAHLERALADSSSYSLWGVGEAAFKLLALPPLTSRTTVKLVDGNPSRRGFRFGGVPVGAPEDLVTGNEPIVVASLIRADSIVAAAQDLGLADRIVRLDEFLQPRG